jgi:hypothetical protein
MVADLMVIVVVIAVAAESFVFFVDFVVAAVVVVVVVMCCCAVGSFWDAEVLDETLLQGRMGTIDHLCVPNRDLIHYCCTRYLRRGNDKVLPTLKCHLWVNYSNCWQQA